MNSRGLGRSKAVRWIGCLGIAGLTMGAQAQDINLNPGLWEWTATMDMADMPPTTHRQCLTREDLIPKDEKVDPRCKVDKFSTENNTVTWTMTCKAPEGTLLHEGHIQYQGDTAEGEIQVSMSSLSMRSTLKGHRVGPCK
ncbi:MAG: DUF3617 family protein [Gammaproteobacteria bacterium]|nr:DUF3617 family protein [Gammaproteobacteria bacterium]MCP5459995.1 DUF3617 family protein [Gammaproteobacteria bacterium]